MGFTKELKGAIEKGQNSMDENLKKLTDQNDIIIDNMNEFIDLMKKVCDKLEIKYSEE